MEIFKRPSQGRGEYELAGEQDGISVKDLYDYEMVFQTDSSLGAIPTGIKLKSQGGKPRFRLVDGGIHLQRQVEALLVLPKSIREEAKLEPGEPVVLRNRYILKRLQIAGIALDGTSSRAIVTLGDIECINQSNNYQISVPERIGCLVRLEGSLEKLPEDIALLLKEHLQLVRSGGPIGLASEKVAQKLMEKAEELAPDYGMEAIPGGDVLPLMMEIADVPWMEEPPSLDQIDSEDIELRRRAAKRWQAFRNRGPAGAKFRRKVREAYNSTCIACGVTLPITNEIRVPGVDAAHILPWATYDLDVVKNGLCLCKLHHWAFDQFLIAVLPHADASYSIAVTDLAKKELQGNPHFLNQLLGLAGAIPQERVPSDPKLRPDAAFLNRLYEDLRIIA
jgi:putative restriction endonuclease